MGSRPKNAVLIATVPSEADFRPNRPHQFPERIGDAALYARNLRLSDAIAFAKVFNLRRMHAPPVREWALVVRAERCHWLAAGNGRGDVGETTEHVAAGDRGRQAKGPTDETRRCLHPFERLQELAFERLQELAGIPADRRFGLDALRRAAAFSEVTGEKGADA